MIVYPCLLNATVQIRIQTGAVILVQTRENSHSFRKVNIKVYFRRAGTAAGKLLSGIIQ
jgi:hypothetical protein